MSLLLVNEFLILLFATVLLLAFKYMRQGFDEMYRSYRTTAQVKLLCKYVPSLTIDDIEPNTYMSGIRAQALDENGII